MGNGKENIYTDVRVLRVKLRLTFEDQKGNYHQLMELLIVKQISLLAA